MKNTFWIFLYVDNKLRIPDHSRSLVHSSRMLRIPADVNNSEKIPKKSANRILSSQNAENSKIF